MEQKLKIEVPHPMTYQSGTFQGSQKNWSTLTKEAYAIYMSFHKMVFYLKDDHVRIRCDHTPLHTFMYSITKNDEMNNWSQEIHAKTPYINLEQIKGKENVLADNLSKLKHVGLYEENYPEKTRYEYSKSIFDNDIENVDISQHIDREFRIEEIKYHIEEKDLNYVSQTTGMQLKDPNSLTF